ncbi:MAG: NAD-dependent epimerase/dehydratase family protein [Planctomycetota bacterium]
MRRPADSPSPPGGPAAAAPTRVAVVGAGFIAATHLEILRRTPGVELAAVADVEEGRARALAAAAGVPHAVTSLAALAELGVEVAHVLVPPDRHAALAREFLERGIGVLVEKPLALSSAEARELAALAAARNLPLGVNHNAACHPGFARLRAEVARGTIGRLRHVQITLSVPLRQLDAADYSHWMFRRPENIVFEQAPHPFSQLVELVGRVRRMDVSLLGTRELLPGQPFHDRWCLAAEAERGTAEIYLAFGEPFPRSTIQVLGTDGSIQADLHHGQYERERKTAWLDFANSFLAGWRRGGLLRRSALAGLARWLATTVGRAERGDGFYVGMRDSIQAFHAAVRAGRPPRLDGEHGAAVLEWCEAAVAGLAASTPAPALDVAPGPPRPGEVVVLGGTGFLGRPTLAGLLARGVPITAVVRRRHALPAVVADGVRAGRIRLFVAALGDQEGLRPALAGARTVLHLATGGGATWPEVERTMVRGTTALAELATAAGAERFLYASSSAALYLGPDCGAEVLGDDAEPDPEPARRAIYARGKAETERALLALARSRGLRVTIVRPAIVVGPGAPFQHSGLGLWVRDNHCVGWGRGRRPAPLVLADDVADALVRLVLHPGRELDGRALNLAARAGLSPRAVVARLAAATGRDLHFHPRPLLLSQALEIGKWIVKRVGGRRDAAFPSWRDLKSRSMHPELRCDLARTILGWRPCDEPEELLRRMVGPRDEDGR